MEKGPFSVLIMNGRALPADATQCMNAWYHWNHAARAVSNKPGLSEVSNGVIAAVPLHLFVEADRTLAAIAIKVQRDSSQSKRLMLRN